MQMLCVLGLRGLSTRVSEWLRPLCDILSNPPWSARQGWRALRTPCSCRNPYGAEAGRDRHRGAEVGVTHVMRRVGSSVVMTCSNCGAENPARQKFCGQCGIRL